MRNGICETGWLKIKRSYQCLACGYNAMLPILVDADTLDATRVRHCQGCRSLIVSAESDSDSGNEGQQRCPDCDSPNIDTWYFKHPCPRCGEHVVRMERQSLI